MLEKDHPNAQQSRLEKIVMVSHNQIFIIDDRSMAFEYANTAALKSLGYSNSELQRLRLTDLFVFPDEMAVQALLNTLRKQQTDRLELHLHFNRKDGSSYDGQALIQVLEQDRSFVLIVNDITDKLITEKKLLHTIHEKEILIKEIHHRVKNNLQLISSIVYLKLASLSDLEIRDFLEDTRQKIRSIALIHERLLQSESLDKVEMADYLGKLIQDLKVTYLREGLTINVSADIHKEMMTLDTAIICGLIVNELLTNAFKHAFKGRQSGNVRVSFITGNQNILIVEDDGSGLPQHIEPGTSNSFGMQLIDVFVKQLNAQMTITRNQGTTFKIQFG